MHKATKENIRRLSTINTNRMTIIPRFGPGANSINRGSEHYEKNNHFISNPYVCSDY